jgi:hypothetical protein
MASRPVWGCKNAARREPREVARAVLTAVKDRTEDVCTYPGNLWQSLVRYQCDRLPEVPFDDFKPRPEARC